VIQASLNLIADVPMLGSGAGTIATLVPTYAPIEDASASQIASAAAAARAEWGEPFLLIATAGVAVAVVAFFIGAIERGRDWSYAAAAAAALCALVAGAFTLSNVLPLPGILLLSAVVGAAIPQRVSRSRPRSG
jgi:hypothetical protein